MARNLRLTEEQLRSMQVRMQPNCSVKTIPAPKKSKYNNVKTTDENGIIHDSKKEAKRWKELRLLFRTGKLVMLARQVEFMLPGNTIYKADFVYCPNIDQLVVEDVKGVRTKEYRIKARLMKSHLGITIIET